MGGRNHIVDESKYISLAGEIFKQHPSFEKYGVSNLGRIRLPVSNFSKNYPGVITSGYKNRYKTMYERVIHIKSNGKDYSKRVHRLVAETWLPQPTEDGLVVDHINSDPQDNRVENLQWVSIKENLQRSHRKKKEKKLTILHSTERQSLHSMDTLVWLEYSE